MNRTQLVDIEDLPEVLDGVKSGDIPPGYPVRVRSLGDGAMLVMVNGMVKALRFPPNADAEA